MKRTCHFALLLCLALGPQAVSAPSALDTSRGDAMIAAYFQSETAKLGEACLAEIKTLDQWKGRREVLRQQLFEMLGLAPMPDRTDLKATVTGRIERDGIVVEKLHFQSRPHLYVTANLYLPKDLEKPAPAILYVCGHGAVKIAGVSYGNKVSYQHHGAWLARHGYVCLAIDTLQLGEIAGIHHGTHREGMWWWINRGYTPAGVEAFNCIRALDYLQSRKEVDPERIGVTGRSGGGAYSWWISAIDDRIKAAVPVAGITDLRNHVVDGCVEGHCDCMFMLNTYRWDYPMVAALVAPRPLMIGNSDRDRIFPLDGVVRTYWHVRQIYEWFKAGDDLGLNIVAGPHKDNQDLQVPAFRWFNKYLQKDTQRLIDEAAVKRFQPQELRVFQELPADQLNSTIHESFVPSAPAPSVPTSAEQWNALRDGWRAALLEKSFRAWPEQPESLSIEEVYHAEQNGLRLCTYDFTSQGPIRLRLYLVDRLGQAKPKRLRLAVVDQQQWLRLMSAAPPAADHELEAAGRPEFDPQALAELQDQLKEDACLAYLAPRGVGRTLWDQNAKKQTQIRRRFMLLGQTLDGMQVWDVRRAIQALRSLALAQNVQLALSGRGPMGGIALYASLFEPDVAELVLEELRPDHRQGPIFLNVSRYLEMPQAVAMACQRSRVRLLKTTQAQWEYPRSAANQLGWDGDRLEIIAQE